MTKKQNLLQSIDRLDQQIAGLQDYLYDAELYPAQIQFWPSIKRAVALFLLRRQVTRQIQQLHLRRRMFRNCYAYLYDEEPESPPLERPREPEEAHQT